MQYLSIKAFFLQPAFLLCSWIFIYKGWRTAGKGSQAGPHCPPSVSLHLLPPPSRPPPRPWCAICQGPRWALRPLPKKCRPGPGSCSGGAQPPSTLHLRPCSTTSLRGLQQQPSPDSRAVRDIHAQGPREHPASGQLVVCKCHHMDIYRNAASRGKEAAPLHFLSGCSKEKPSAPLQSLPPRGGRWALGGARSSAGCTQQAAIEGWRQTITS